MDEQPQPEQPQQDSFAGPSGQAMEIRPGRHYDYQRKAARQKLPKRPVGRPKGSKTALVTRMKHLHIVTEIQYKFIAELLRDGNGTHAAIRAGVDPHDAPTTASRWLKNPDILSALEEAKAEMAMKLNITPSKTLREWARMAFAEIPGYVEDENGTVKVVPGKAAEIRVLSAYLKAKTSSLEALSKHLGLFEKDNNQKQVIVQVVSYVDAESTDFNSDGSRRQ